MIPIAKPQIGIKEKNAVMKVLESGIIAEGPKVSEFEKLFAQYLGVKYSIAVNSGTAALHVSLLAHKVGKDDEVITSPFTFIASANSVLFTGAKPVFADIEEDTFNIDPNKILERITYRTKAILSVHLFGHPADMKAITEIADGYNLIVIEDACQAHASKFNGKYVGTFGTGNFSFYSTKNITTGEGGIITTDDPVIYESCRLLRSHGSKQRYLHEILGYNFRMTDIAAAIGIEQLKKLDRLYLFSWNEIPGNDNERLIESLKQKFGIDWVKTAKIEKIEDGKTIKVSTDKNYLSLKLNDEKTKVNLKIDDGRTDEFIVKMENGKLNIYDRFNKTRQRNAAYMNSKLKGIAGIVTPITRRNCEHVFHQYSIRITEDCKLNRDSLAKILNEKGIGIGIYYPMPIHKQPYYSELGYKDSLPIAEKISEEVLSLPVHPAVSMEDMDFIISTIEGACE